MDLVAVGYILNSFLLLMSGALVFFMGAGFAMLETGLTRSKNAVTILSKNVLVMWISVAVFFVIGYPLMYGEGLSNAFLQGMSNSAHSLMSDFFFQAVFVATAASVISGAVAERMKMFPFLLFTVLLSGLIYPIVGMWTWGGGFLFDMGFSDFAGSTIVHSVGGWAALAAVIVLGPRLGKYSKDGKSKAIPGSNLALATLGTFILVFGWFGFNGGSQLSMSSITDIDAIGLVFSSTLLGAAFGGLASTIVSYVLWKKIDLTMVLNGTLAGLVAVTAGPNIGLLVASVEGLVGGILVVAAILFIDKKLKIDDPVGALSVHLVGGIWGTLAVGIFNPSVSFLTQLSGVGIIGAFVFATSYVCWKLIDKLIAVRVSEDVEYIGLDLEETGLEAYPEFVRTKGV